jgi:hypothetical protein
MAKKKTSKAREVPVTVSKSVEVKKISNGYIVSTWTDKGQKEKFVKTKKEVKIVAGRML